MSQGNFLFLYLLIFLLKGSGWVFILCGPIRVLSPKGTIVCYSSLGDSIKQLRQTSDVMYLSMY